MIHRISTTAIVLCLLSIAACRAPLTSIPQLEDERRDDSRQLVAALESGRPDERARAALAMGRIQSVAYLSALVAAVTDDDRDVRVEAIFALGQLGLAKGAEVPPEAFDACHGLLGDPDPVIVARAVEALGKLATARVPDAVRPLLAHENPSVRAEAALALFRCRFVPLWREQAEEPPPLPDDARLDLIALSSDSDIEVRLAAAYAFSRYGQPDAVLELATLVGDEVEWIRLFAVRGIGNSGDASVADVIVRATRDQSHRVRTEAVMALDRLDRVDLISDKLSYDRWFHVRAAVATAYAGVEDDVTRVILHRLELDKSATVRAAAIESLATRLGGDYTESLERHATDQDWRIRAAAVRGARHLESASLAWVEQGLQDADTRVNTAALGSLEGREEGDDLILYALESDDLAVRGTAVTMLAERDPPGKLDRLAATYDASAGVEWIEIREALVDAVAEMDDARPLLERIVSADPASSVRDKARRALAGPDGGIEPSPALPVKASSLLGTRFERDPVIRIETSKGTMRIRGLAQQAPIHVANFVKLVEEGFYDGLTWHRVVSNFVIQGGDPRGDGWGTAGYTLRDEINRERYFRGAVGMPKAGKDTGGCQIFITHLPTPHLDGNYTVFGRVISGLDVIDRIEVGDRIIKAELIDPDLEEDVPCGAREPSTCQLEEAAAATGP